MRVASSLSPNGQPRSVCSSSFPHKLGPTQDLSPKASSSQVFIPTHHTSLPTVLFLYLASSSSSSFLVCQFSLFLLPPYNSILSQHLPPPQPLLPNVILSPI